MDDKKLKTVPLNKIKISDQFWNRYIHLVKDVLIPYQWDILNDRLPDVETSHCIENFKIAAGETDGDFEGAVFQDTDVAKWLEAVAYTIAGGRGEHLEELADQVIDLIGKAQEPDGYLNTYFTIKDPSKRWTNLKEGHELYTAGHMTEAAVAYYKATGKTEFLDIMKKFADLICKTFGPDEGQIHGYPGHQEIELALVKLYRVTREKKYLDLALCCCLTLEDEERNNMSVRVTEGILQQWEISEEDLFRQAYENMQNAGYHIINMMQIIKECGFEGEMPATKMFVLTNRKQLYGAAGILETDLLKNFSDRIGKNLFILPSSIHEVILIPDEGRFGESLLKEMIMDVNENVLQEEDFLADHAYYFDREKGEVRVA